MNIASPSQIRRHAQIHFLCERDCVVASASAQPWEAHDWLRSGVSGRDRLHPMTPKRGQAGQNDSTKPGIRQVAGVIRSPRDKSNLQGEKKKTNAW
jgi:hypothetical protein